LNRRTFIGAAATWVVAMPLAEKALAAPSPDGTAVPPAASITDANGGVWTLGNVSQYGKNVLLNGASAAGGQGTLINWQNNQLKVQNNLGDWWLWGNGSWSATTAPGGTPPPPPPPPPSDDTFVTSGDGGNNVAEGGYSGAGGAGSRTGPGANGAFAWGQGATALGGGAVAFGRGSLAAYTDTFVVGQGCEAHADNGRSAGWCCLSYADQGFAHGYQADDRGIDGLEAYAHGNFGTGTEDLGGGTAQTCRVVLRAQTSDATPTPLTTDGDAFGFNNQMRLPDNASYVVQWLVVARDIASGDSRAWRVLAMATRGASAGATAVFAPIITDIGSSPSASGWGISVTADTYNGAVQLNGIGQAGRSLNWVAAMIDAENVG
jgi:hypothetical protein